VKSSIKRRFKTRHWVTVCIFAVGFVGLTFNLRSEAQSGTTYAITDLGPVGNGISGNPSYGINNLGDIVGIFLPAGSSFNHPFFRKHGTLTNIDITPGANGSGNSLAVNTSGSTVGYFDSGVQRAFIWSDLNNDGISQPGELTYLSPSNLAAIAFGLNDGGHAVGVIEDGTGLGGSAFEWDAVSGLHTLSGNGTVSPFFGFAINNLANVVGLTAQGHAFARLNGNYVDLGTLSDPSLHSAARSISEDNYVVGYSETPSDSANRPNHAFIWFDSDGDNESDLGEMKDLGILSGGANVASEAYDINASHQIVGTAELTSGGTKHAVLWHDDDCNGQYGPSEIRDLNNLISDPSWTLQYAQSINDGGLIVGFGLHSGQLSGFLLTPSSPPPSPCSSPTPTPTPANQMITVNPHAPANAAYNSQFTVAATASSGLDVTYSSAGACTNTGATFMMTSGTGTCTVKYDQAGNANYNAAPQVTENVTAQKASATITLSNLTQVFDGLPKFATASTTPSGLTVNITYSQNGNPVSSPTSLGAYAVSAVISDANYQGSTTGTLNIVEPAAVILLETGTSNAAAVDSVTFVRGPFHVTDNFNFSGDHLTRIIIFTSPLANPDQTLSVKASGIDLPIESVGNVTGVSGLNASYIIVKLPPGLQVNQPTTFGLTVTLRNVTSNTADLIINP